MKNEKYWVYWKIDGSMKTSRTPLPYKLAKAWADSLNKQDKVVVHKLMKESEMAVLRKGKEK